jgi:hypothetical protein
MGARDHDESADRAQPDRALSNRDGPRASCGPGPLIGMQLPDLEGGRPAAAAECRWDVEFLPASSEHAALGAMPTRGRQAERLDAEYPDAYSSSR